MATACKEICKRFYDLIEEDEDFFDGYGLSEDEQEILIQERAMSLLNDACVYLRRHCDLDVTLETVVDVDMGTTSFTVDLIDTECELLALAMKVKYYERKVARLGPVVMALSASEMKYAPSPNAERTTYLALVKRAKDELDEEISHYASRDRLTGAHKSINYAIPEESDEDE